MEPLASVADVEARGATVGQEQVAQLEHLLRLGSARLRLRFATIDARLAAGALDPVLVKDVLVAMVLRAPSWANPGGVKSETIGAGTYSATYDSASMDELTLTDGEVALLAPVPSTPVPSPIFGSAQLIGRLGF